MNRLTPLLLFFGCILFLTPLSAQTLSIEQSTFEHKGQARPSVQVIVDVPPKFLKKEWVDYLKDEYGVKLKGMGFLSNKDMLTAEEAILPPLSGKALDLYTYFSADNGITTFNVFAAYGYDMYAGSGKFTRDLDKLQSITHDFLQQLLPEYYQEEVSAASERVDDLTDEVDDLTEGIADHKEEIEQLRKEIASKEKKLEERKTELERAKAALEKAQTNAKNIAKVLEREQG